MTGYFPELPFGRMKVCSERVYKKEGCRNSETGVCIAHDEIPGPRPLLREVAVDVEVDVEVVVEVEVTARVERCGMGASKKRDFLR